MKEEHFEKLRKYFLDKKHQESILFYDKVEGKKVEIPIIYEASLSRPIITGDDSEIYDFEELDLIDDKVLNDVFEQIKAYVVHVKGEFVSVHWSKRGELIQVDGYFPNEKKSYSEATFTKKLQSAKIWKRKKDAENRLVRLLRTDINKKKSLIGEVIEVTITFKY